MPDPKEQILVFCGNHDQFRFFSQTREGRGKRLYFLGDPEMLRGLESAKIIFYGSYLSRNDYGDMIHAISDRFNVREYEKIDGILILRCARGHVPQPKIPEF